MNLLAHAALLIAAVAHPQHHDKPRHHLGPVRVEPNASAYCPGSSGTTMADGRHVYFGAIASAYLPMHTLIRVRHAIDGRHFFRVRDRGGASMRMDIWLPSCSEAVRFGRRAVRFQVVGR
jgi:3D (Asp-Asp-Asp) domain-containing protein